MLIRDVEIFMIAKVCIQPSHLNCFIKQIAIDFY